MTSSEQAVRTALGPGPMTSKELADHTGLSILTVRSRLTELLSLGDVMRAGNKRGDGYTHGRPWNLYALKRGKP